MQARRPRRRAPQEESDTQIDQAPLTLRLSEGERAIVVRYRAWRRLKRRVLDLPQTSPTWLASSSLLAGVSITERDNGVVAIASALGAVGCFLAYRAVGKLSRKIRKDIVEEMELHES